MHVGVTHGVEIYACRAANSQIPLGTVWTVLGSDHFGRAHCEIIDIYVPEKFRRMGVARLMLTWLLDAYGTLKTGTGTKAGGMKLIRSMGFILSRADGVWILRKKVKRVAPA